jgi:aspartyl-tRNA(Asn)/glutamyl-tRNA(Gln) amidotransferase subunit A
MYAQNEIVYMTAVELAERYRSRELSPVEAVAAHVRRIDELDERINCYITLTPERAVDHAKASESRHMRGAPLGLLDGVPFGAKDIFATQGIRTTHGSKLAANNIPSETSTAIERLEATGAVLLGKLNLLEFATGGGTDSGFGPARNPWNLDYEPGGSSSGSGAALAAGLATLALGTDTGGSIRNPAARCGIVGLKPTYGRVSRHGVTPLAWTLDHAGPMARTVRDTARMLGVISGFDPRDRSSAREAVPDFDSAVVENGSLRGKRFAVAKELMTPVEPGIRELVERALADFERHGAKRVDVSIPHAGVANIAAEILIDSEAAVYHEQNLQGAESRALMDPVARMFLTSGRFYLATDYVKSQRLRLQLQAEFEGALSQADVLVCPTDPTYTSRIGASATLLGRHVALFEYGNQCFANLIGAPAISVPCGFTEGLPVGLQIIGRAFDEARVLAFAHGYEQASEWVAKHPVL